MPAVDSTISFVESKGFGWLLEVDNDDQELYARPLLEELDIHPRIIFRNIVTIACVVRSSVVRDSLLVEHDFWGPFSVVSLLALLSMWGQLQAVSYLFVYWLVGSAVLTVLLTIFVSPPTGDGRDTAEHALTEYLAPESPLSLLVLDGGVLAVLAVLGYATGPLVAAVVPPLLATVLGVDASGLALFCRVRPCAQHIQSAVVARECGSCRARRRVRSAGRVVVRSPFDIRKRRAATPRQLIGVAHATLAAAAILAPADLKARRALVVVPLALFYSTLACINASV